MKLFLDSGAYSAWANKSSVDVHEYIKFIRQNEAYLETYACLDDITNPEKTWENQHIMESEGLHPLPVWHTGEADKYFDRAMKYPYFAVGGMALSGATSRQAEFNKVFLRLCTKASDFYPSHKVHGFGLASPSLLVSYPWYSVDTTSWVMYGRYGIILVPSIDRNGQYNYYEAPQVVTISSRSKATGSVKHFNNLEGSNKQVILKYCEEKGFPLGKTLTKLVDPGYVLKENEKWIDKKAMKERKKNTEFSFFDKGGIRKDRVEVFKEAGLRSDGEMRDAINLMYFLDLEKHQKKYPWQWRKELLENSFQK